MYSERHYIIVPASLEAQANAEAVKWDPDSGGAQTFSAARLTSDGTTATHLASCGLIDVDYIPPGQGGQTALQVLDAFYATGHYKGYRIQRPDGDLSALLTGTVDVWRPDRFEDGLPVPAGWVTLGTGNIAEMALVDAGLSVYVEPETAEWQAGVSYSVGEIVTYQGAQYECIQAHTSQVGWEPPNVPALWTVVE